MVYKSGFSTVCDKSWGVEPGIEAGYTALMPLRTVIVRTKICTPKPSALPPSPSHRLCTTEEGPCASSGSGRCCCQAYNQSVLYLGCQEEVGLEERIAVGQCSCQVCRDFEVTFVGRVQDGDGKPVVLATVAVDGIQVDISNEIGLFGFTVLASQSSITLKVASSSYASFERSYDVIPGETNIVYVTLMEAVVMVIVPPQELFVLSVYDLKIVAIERIMDVLASYADQGGSMVIFPARFFEENTNYIFVAIPSDIRLDEDITSPGFDFTASQISRRRASRTKSVQSIQIENESRISRQVAVNLGSNNWPFSAAAIGRLDVMKENGDPNENSGKEVVISTLFVNSSYSLEELHTLQVYLLNHTTEQFFQANAVRNITAMEGGIILVEFTLDVTFPLFYVIAFHESKVCYTAARAFDPSRNNIELFTPVRAVTRGHEGRRVSVVYGSTGSCLAIPCQGALEIELVDTQEYDPSRVTVDDIETSLLEQTSIFRREILCYQYGLENDFFGFDLVPSELLPPQVEITTDSDLEGPPFCFAKVDVALCPGMAARVLGTTPAGDVSRDNVESSEVFDEHELAVGCGFTCSDHQEVCLRVSCDTQNTVTVTLLPDDSNPESSEVCSAVLPLPDPGGLRLENVAPLGVPNFVFELQSLTGVYTDELSEDVARRKCKWPSSPANIQFQCHPT